MKMLAVISDMSGREKILYDPEKKYFCEAMITGCAHEGIYREYFHISKAETIQMASAQLREIESGKNAYVKALPRPLPISEIEALEEAPDWQEIPLPPEELLY